MFSRSEWEDYKTDNMVKLQLLSVLIDSAANINSKLAPAPVSLSRREEQCLIWAARGKTYQEIADILNQRGLRTWEAKPFNRNRYDSPTSPAAFG